MTNSAPQRFLKKVPTDRSVVFGGTLTAAEITAGKVVVPAVAGYQFVPKHCGMRAFGGTCSGPTTINFAESTSNGVVTSHVSADLAVASGWRYSLAGDGTVVTTLLGKALTVSEGVKVIAVGGSANTAMTSMDYFIEGYYLAKTNTHSNH